MKSNGNKHIRSAPYHPDDLSKGLLRKMDFHFLNFLLMYRSTPHTTTGIPPATLFLGRNLFNLLRPDLERRVYEKQADQKKDNGKTVRVCLDLDLTGFLEL